LLPRDLPLLLLRLPVLYHCSAKQSLVSNHSWVVDPCHLAPSACSADGHLTRLALPVLGLACGGFPAQLGGLRFLQRLDLSGNNLEGATMQQVAEVRGEATAAYGGPILCCCCHNQMMQEMARKD
jgi:hypothetical protein